MSILKLWFAGWIESMRRIRRDRQREIDDKIREEFDWDFKMMVEEEQWKARIWTREMRW